MQGINLKNSLTMKQLIIAFLILMTVSLLSCAKELDYTFNEYKVVELEDAVRRTPAAGLTYPIIAITRTSGRQSLQVNLVGEKLTEPQDMTFSLDTAISSALTANNLRAVEGTHFNLNGSKFTVGKDSSFARINIDIPVGTAQAGKTAFFVVKLDGNNDIKPSENYRRVGFRIDLK
jgi:hypothetical protein